MIGKLIKWVITWLIGSFVMAVVSGTLIWYVMSVFGRDLGYFSYIRGWFVTVLIIDIILDLWKWNRKKERGYW